MLATAIYLSITATLTTATSNNYYKSIDPTKPLLAQLKPLLQNHTVISYNEDWSALGQVDRFLNNKCKAPMFPDVYSGNCWNSGKTNTPCQCGNYKKEGDCWNREHGWPKSWFGGFSAGKNAETDLHELWASDGYVNGLRGNLPLGAVTKPTYTSSNGAKIGPCASANAPAGNCFEVGDEFKGDFARSYFYLSTTYNNEWKCCDEAGVNGSHIKPWMEAVLRTWHKNDPPDALEKKFNDAVFNLQKNRCPFIDHPEWVALIPDF